jgi:hypothetical protein
MDIKYLMMLNQYPSVTMRTGYVKRIEKLPIEEIVNLEYIYNSGYTFPKALRELLYLAGKSCYVLDYGRNNSQEEMQQRARGWFTAFGRLGPNIERPFYVIDVYNAGAQFLFVYLDEGKDDPIVYEANLDMSDIDDGEPFIHSLERTLSTYLNLRFQELLSRYNNPF